MQTKSIHTIYQVVVIAKLTYASSAWWGFTAATDRQRLEAVIRRGIRSGLSSSNQLPLAEIAEDADGNLFSQVLYNNSHVLNSLLPSTNTRTYNLRQRVHNRTLVAKTSTLTESKNGPAPFPGHMSYKATKPGLVFVLYLSMFFIVLVFIRAPFYVLLVFVVCVLPFGCSS